jgi:hypothetical protein
LTSPSGFRATVVEAPQPTLLVFKGITDQFVEGNRSTSFNLPADAFAHTRADAVVTVEAKLTDGQALPAWMQFDARAGTFSVTPPPGFTGALEIKVTARDNEGRAADAIFKFNVGAGIQEQAPTPRPLLQAPVPGPDSPQPQSRSSLSEQIRLAQGRSGLSASAWRAAFLRGEVGLLPAGLEAERAAAALDSTVRSPGLLERILASRGVQQRLTDAATGTVRAGETRGSWPDLQVRPPGESAVADPNAAPTQAPRSPTTGGMWPTEA